MHQSNLPQLRFKGFSGPWIKKKIGKITDVFAGGTPKTVNPEYWGGNYKWMNSGELNQKRIYDVKNRITEMGLRSSSTKIIPKKCILVGLAGQGKTRGTVAINLVELCTNQSVASIYPSKSHVPEFLYFNLDNRYHEIRRLSTGDGGRGGLNLKIIKSITVFLPILDEQIKISSFLTAVDSKIKKLTRKKELLEEYKKGVMQKLFSQEIRFKDDSGNDYPEWQHLKIGSISYCLDNKRIPLNETQRNSMIGNIPYYGANGVVDYINEFIFDEDLVLLAEDGGNFNEFANKPIAQYLTGKTWVNNHAHILRANLNIITNKFLFYSLIHKDIRKHIVGGGRAKLNRKDLLKILIAVPSLIEQNKIVKFFDGLFLKIDFIDSQIDKTKDFKKGLLQQMFV